MGLVNIKYTIGKVATLSAVTRDTLRHYEKKGLITSVSKTDAGYRIYSEDTVHRVRFIKQAQSYGFTLSEINKLLKLKHADNFCCEDVRNLTIEKKLKLEQKLTLLQATLHSLNRLIKKCPGGKAPIENCVIMGALENRLEDDAKRTYEE